MNYDIIGDIHGQANKLTTLLDKLGYKKQQGIYQQEGHQAVFVGDFVDRGKQQKQVISIVRPMIDTGKALAVMGNHEFNAICYHSLNTNTKDQYLREHNEKNSAQHEAFLNEYPVDHAETNEVINWFKTLPLFLELEDEFRVIHACWDEYTIDNLITKDYLNNDNSLKTEFFPQAAQKGHELYEAIEILLKGKEISLPSGASFQDKDGNTRHKIRIKWWKNNLKTYQQASVLEIDSLITQDDIPLPENIRFSGYPKGEIPIFFGHYWFTGEPQSITHNVACLDYSAAKSGPLISYRWEGAHSLQGRNFLGSDFNEFDLVDVVNAHKHIDDKNEITNSILCGCFYCLSIFESEEIDNFEQGVWCPRCGIDSVLGENSGYPITRDFLAAMNRHWF